MFNIMLFIISLRNMKPITVKLPDEHLRLLDDLVVEGTFSSRSEALREGVRDLLRKYRKS